MAEINIRYLQDTDGERYFPMTHVNAILGLEEFDNGDDVENLQQIIRSLNTTISTLQTRVSTLETENVQMKQDIEILKASIIPPEEGE
ncbi:MULTISPECIES: ELKS/Rab6-interacting/CAST family protein [unclassified Mammaliicoccus]|uniref:ELKS/Rab6-interacting/CAST family protein n=1 Tax=unclassified Mammaliicoccus TaxID=2803851 RepID=UPI001EFACF4F|nr:MULTISPECIES: ELKS/Rab6-interacting/CAST family protein [unclassified Mammaliicoccus]